MLRALLILSLIIVVFSTQLEESLYSAWKLFKHTYKKEYTSRKENEFRQTIFQKNFKYIQNHNIEYSLGLHQYILGMNKFGDMYHEEFLAKYTSSLHRVFNTTSSLFVTSNNTTNLPDTVDWRDEGYVTPVKEQGSCGSCYAFSATGALEGQLKNKTGQLISLSEQQIVDCSKGHFGNFGCQGGWPEPSFYYVKENHGINSEETYPYEAKDNNCRFDPKHIAATCTSFNHVTQESEDELQAAIATIGPISVVIDASQPSFQFYKSGVYDEPKCNSVYLDHAVLIVGYGKYEGTDYYLVKNSWGKSWGQKGYIYMSRNKGNQCGIATLASYPIM